jgi:amidase
VPGMGLLGDLVAEERSHILEIGPDSVRLGRLRLQVRPMLGVIGVAPAAGAVSTVSPGRHGGNLDCALVAAGSRVHLPVFAPGALFAAGDMHAAMGDGEVSGTGIEVPGTALLSLGVRKLAGLEWPWVEDSQRCAVMVSADNLEAAGREAMLQIGKRLSAILNVDFADAYMIAGACVHLRICQVVNPQVTVRAEIAKSILPEGERLI